MDANYKTVAEKALEWVRDGARIGLGSGRTTEAFLHCLSARIQQGLRIRGVPTSSGTAQLAQKLGIPLDTLDSPEPLDVTVDGADEVDPDSLNLIKGWGGALVRERIVAAGSREQIIIVTPEKLVKKLGQRGKLPVEVIPFAESLVRRRIESLVPLGIRPEIRMDEGKPFVTDNGNHIFDCAIFPLDYPLALADSLRAIPGVVDVGLFFGTASVVLIAEDGKVRELRRS